MDQVHPSISWKFTSHLHEINLHTLGIRIPEVSGIQMVQSRSVLEWSGFQVVDHLILDKKHPVFERLTTFEHRMAKASGL